MGFCHPGQPVETVETDFYFSIVVDKTVEILELSKKHWKETCIINGAV